MADPTSPASPAAPSPTPAPPPQHKPGIATSEAWLIAAVVLIVLGISVGWIPTPPNVSALATQIVLAALAAVYAVLRSYVKTSNADLPPSIQNAIGAVLSSLTAAHKTPPPTATAAERKPEAGRVSIPVISGVACLALSTILMASTHGCSSVQKPGQPTIGSAAGSALACTEADFEKVASNPTAFGTIATALLADNYELAITTAIADLGVPLAQCAIVFIDDVEGAIEGALVATGSGSSGVVQDANRATIETRAHAIRVAHGW
jgi:hypothetical protein